MKYEFEELIGKEITDETYSMYEKMYLALPENIDKQQFVKMLNIDAIPENPTAIERRNRRNELIEKAKSRIAEYKNDIKYYKEQIEFFKSLDSTDCNFIDDDFIKNEIEHYKLMINNSKSKIAETKMIYGL